MNAGILSVALLLAAATPMAAIAQAGGQTGPGASGEGGGVTLTIDDAVTSATLPLGVASILRLQTNPSTGYGRQVVETVNLKVEEPFEIVRDPATPDGMVGAPETAVLRITPRGKGPASLTLVYKQAWMDGAPDDRRLMLMFVAE